jgi:hypothetical protein
MANIEGATYPKLNSHDSKQFSRALPHTQAEINNCVDNFRRFESSDFLTRGNPEPLFLRGCKETFAAKLLMHLNYTNGQLAFKLSTVT